MEGKFVAYYRVSTQRQGKSGLGLEAQQKAVMDYLNGGGWKLLAEYTEVETGKGSRATEKRPVLKEAMDYAKKHRATLIIAKLDRLARNVHFITGLMESKVRFVCADLPEANNLTLQVLAAVAEYEGKRISDRTREALAQAKARGVKLGNPDVDRINTARVAKADEFALHLKPTLEAFRKGGMTQRGIVQELNRLGITTARGKEWSLVQVQRVMARLGLK